MDTFLNTFGWWLLLMAVIFAIGILPSTAKYFYPENPTMARRVAPPVIFGFMAIACLAGVGYEALVVLLAVGIGQILYTKLNSKKAKAFVEPTVVA